MAPEAYVLDAALYSWGKGDPPETIRDAAAGAYAAYQKISRATYKGKNKTFVLPHWEGD